MLAANLRRPTTDWKHVIEKKKFITAVFRILSPCSTFLVFKKVHHGEFKNCDIYIKHSGSLKSIRPRCCVLQASVKGSSTTSSFSQTLKSDTKLIFVSLFAKGHFIAISIQRTLLKHQLLYFLKLLRKCVIRFKIISLLGNRPVNFVYYAAQFD